MTFTSPLQMSGMRCSVVPWAAVILDYCNWMIFVIVCLKKQTPEKLTQKCKNISAVLKEHCGPDLPLVLVCSMTRRMQQPPRLFCSAPVLPHPCTSYFPLAQLRVWAALGLALVATKEAPCYSSKRSHQYQQHEVNGTSAVPQYSK